MNKINKTDFSNPCMIVTDDKHFGNKISKPRACVVVDRDDKGRLLVSPVEPRTTKVFVLDKMIDRQVINKKRWIDISEVYETKLIDDLKNLTQYDKHKIIEILRK